MTTRGSSCELDRLILRHLRLGWMGLGLVIVLGIFLEGLHAFKAPWYLALEHETRRLMWRLAHAHAAGLSLLSIAFAVTLPRAPRLAQASLPLCLGIVSCPLGFFLGGVGAQGADPSLGILLLPIGAGCLLVAVGLVMRALFGAPEDTEPPREDA